jgi:hypothetical protein
MKLLFVAVMLVIAGSVMAQPSNVLVYHDVYGAYGTAVITAVNNLWPGCNLVDCSGGTAGYATFNAALASQAWDIVVAEMWYYNTDDLAWYMLNDIYDTTPIFVSSWEWASGESGQMTLANTMGVTAVTGFGAPVVPHYAWEPSHPICAGITDWSWADPGLGILNGRMTVSDAVPVTGWTATSTPGQGGICVANNGQSIISGYTPAYATDAVNIWENILGFMYGGGGALQQSTWGAIKAGF